MHRKRNKANYAQEERASVYARGVRHDANKSQEQGGPLTPRRRTRVFFPFCSSIFTCKIGPKCSTKVAHLCVAFHCLFHPHAYINGGDGASGATASRAWGGSMGASPLRDSTALFLYLSTFTCKVGLDCSEILLISVWNLVAFAHLRYLKMIPRFCLEG